ncbi:hypothetical protein ALQ04_01305 [Pseudomonas cichorii]|uniref:Uncharacterized protein n=1 Tax=Pseudomonas cichorii TaxID=36746 RepID=A0A3M4M7C9_PSECI|nr:hypothetical protein [Pseudomonas cichorii]RMQ49828.1 hypothetical protein ALQ04_01305 [Pseudomonas cichorii]
MQISNVISLTPNLQLPTQAKATVAEKITPPKAEQAMSKEARAKAFYTREEEPWKGEFYYNGKIGAEETKTPMTKEKFLRFEEMKSASQLRIQQSIYDRFRKELIELKPDLASKGFSYTLGDDAEIKVISYDNSLSEDEIKWLTKALNDMDSFKESVQSHARTMMTLVDHDTETFGGKYNLNLLNFQDTIDYGKIVAIRKNNLNEEWIKQIHQNAEKRETHIIDIKA